MNRGVAGVLDDRSLRRVVVVLCVGQITSWGVLYYALPVLSAQIAADTGWSTRAVVAAFSTGLMVNAVAGVATGRAIDRHGPRPVMTAGSVLAVPALAGIALAPTYPLFLAAWVLAGVAMSATLYPPSFAAVTGWAGPHPTRRIRALTAITLVGGLASTVFAPLTAGLADHLDWRDTYLVLAAVLAVVTIPAHALGLGGDWDPPRTHPHQQARPRDGASSQAWFWILAVAFTLAAFAVYASVVNLVPLLLEHGLDATTAAVVLGIGGIGQVAGRLAWAPIATRTHLVPRTLGVLGLVAVSTAALAVIPGPVALLAVAAFVAGTARGIVTLLQATAISDRWSTTDFGRHNGLLNAPIMTASAVSPWIGAALAAALGSYSDAFGTFAAAALLAAALIPLTIPARTQLP